MSCNILKLENEHLSDDNCFLATLINVSENIFIENNIMILERQNNIVTIDLDDIFLSNYIRCPTLDPSVDKQYFAETCNDLKPFLKILSWKDTRFLVTEERQIKNIVTEMFLDTQSESKVTTLNAYINNHNDIINIWSHDWGIKFQGDNKGFGVYKNSILFFNTEQFMEREVRREVEELTTMLKGKVVDG